MTALTEAQIEALARLRRQLEDRQHRERQADDTPWRTVENGHSMANGDAANHSAAASNPRRTPSDGNPS